MFKRFLCTAVAAVAVVFTVRAEYAWHYDSTKNRIWTEDSDTGETNWVFSVALSGSTVVNLSTCISGEGDLDFSTIEIPGRTLTSSGGNALSNNAGLTGFLNTGPMTSVSVKNNPNLKQLILPNVTSVGNYTLQANATLTNVTFSAELKAIGGDILKSCPLLESILPERMPKLESIGSLISTTPTALNLRLDAPELTTMGKLGAITVSKFVAPKMQTLDANAFTSVKFAEGAGDLSFPELETLAGNTVFKWSGLTSLYAPKLANISSQSFYECSSLTNLTFSDALKTVVASSVYNCPKLARFSPLLPANMTAVTDFFSNKENLLGGPLVWDQNSTTVIAASFMAYSPLTNFVFISDVTSVGAKAFAMIGPRAEIHFYGPTVPTLGNGAFYRTNAEANNDRPTIHIHNSSSAAGWMALAAPNADKLETYKEKPDCPADVVGLIALPNASGATPIYAYLVNDAAVAGTGYLSISGTPLDFDAVNPAYGVHADIPIGDKFTCTAPSVCLAPDMRGGLAGYVVSNVLATGETTFRDEGQGNSYAYEQLENSAQLTWIWTNVQYRVAAAGEGGGLVDVAEQWVDYLGTATITAVPVAGKVFRRWTGDVSEKDAYGQTLMLTVDAPKAVTAVFTDPVDYAWSYDAAKGMLNYGGVDGLDVKWSFTVTEKSGDLTLGSYVSGFGDLDFSSFDVDGKTLVASGGNALTSCPGLTGYLNTGTMTSVTVKNNPYLRQLILPNVTSVATYSLQANAMMTNVTFSSDLEAIGGDVFKGCQNLESILPERLPKLKSIGSLISSTPTALTLRLDVPELTVMGQLGAVSVAKFQAPKLKTLNSKAFQSVKFAASCSDLSLPELAGMADSYAFRYSTLTSLSAPMLTNVTSMAFDCCDSLTNLVFSDKLKRISSNAFGNCPKLETFSPLLPAGLDFLGATPFGSGNSADRLTGSLVWDNPEIHVVPAYLMQKSPLSSVVFRSDVTAVMTNAFAALAPSSRIEFHGPTVPDLVRTPFDHDGEADDTRVRIYVFNKAALEGWREKVAPYDALYRSDYRRKKADWPGRQTLGILELSSGHYAWVVDGGLGPGFSVLVK